MEHEGIGRLTPAEMAERTGVSLDTLRDDERLGLITDVERGVIGHRRCSADDVGWDDVVASIAEPQQALQVIKGRIATYRRPAATS